MRWGWVAAAVATLALAPVAAVALRASGSWAPSPADWAAVRFTLMQAALSSVVSVLLAVPLARALARRRFPLRAALITLLGAPFLLPALVAVLGLLAVFGRAGWLNAGLQAAGLPAVSIYGLHGVVLAHVFLNLPLAARLILFGWSAIPGERLRLARALGFGPAEVFRHLELPLLRQVVPGALVAVFAVCLTSFAVALVLGGGPRATTVELAIYQAVRFEFDLAGAARLALIQMAICALAWVLAARVAMPAGFGAGLDRAHGVPAPGGWRRFADTALILAAALFLTLPLAAVAARGLPGLGLIPGQVWAAAARSVAVALAAAALAVALALPLALAAARGARVAGLAATLPLALSGLVLGTGLFLILHPHLRPAAVALPVTAVVNALLSLPFVFRVLEPGAVALRSHDRLADSLGIHGAARLRLVTLPRLAAPLGFGAGLAAALAIGDLGAIALFAAEGGETLPLLVSRLLGAYRIEAAASASLLMVALAFGLFALLERVGRHAGA